MRFLKSFGGVVATLLGLTVGVALAAQWDSTPGIPEPAITHPTYSGFNFSMYHDKSQFWYEPDPIAAQHSATCGGPPATHQVTTWADSIFVCNAHVMTALNADYGEIVITPTRLLDWMNGPATIQWEMSTERMSGRDWVDVLVSPFTQNAINYFEVGFNSFPETGFMATNNFQGTFVARRIDNYNVQQISGDNFFPKLADLASGNDAANRQPFKITIGNGRFRMEMMASQTNSCPVSCVFFDETYTPPFSQGVVQFGHHSYNPTKDGAGVPATWHWDEMVLSPSVAFTDIKATQRVYPVSPATGNQTVDVHFTAPSPAGSFLRFAGTVATAQVSFDGGATWQAAHETTGPVHHSHLASSYLHPMPAGIQDIKVRYTVSSLSSGHVRDFSIWSLGGVTSTPTPVPTQVPPTPVTPTPTPPLPTSTAVPATPTIPLPTTTSTPVPPSPTATATAIPATPTTTPIPCFSAYWQGGVIKQGAQIPCP